MSNTGATDIFCGPRIEFFVPTVSKPRSTQTGTVIRVRSKNPFKPDRLIPLRRGADWTRQFKLLAWLSRPNEPLRGPLKAEFWVYFRRPKKPKPMAELYPIVRPDFDNLCKGLSDTMNNTIFEDDSQIVDASVYKRYVLVRYRGEGEPVSDPGIKVIVSPK